MKKIICIFVLIMLLSSNVYALKSTDANLTTRNKCDNYELAIANSDDSITHVSCYDNYSLAKAKMNESEEKNLIILERKNNKTSVIDAKYALVSLDRGDTLTYVYSNKECTQNGVYMNNASAYGAVDGAFIELNYSNKAVKIMIGGLTGWIKSDMYKIIPISWVKSSSYYKIDDKSISHFYVKNIENTNIQGNRTLGPKPIIGVENGRYYSYDGIYFYNSYYDMIDDYRENKHERSLNKDHAYYNYYLYLPHRSKTNYDIDDFEVYIRKVLNFKGSVYGTLSVNNYSVIYGASEYYMYSEKLYGANALSVFSLSRNESANGTSSIARNKNNIFGHDAVDGAAYQKASGYLDVRSSIYTHGHGYIDFGYARVSDWRYYGTHFGNKYRGMNVQYASDVYWGEKAASYYYNFDYDNGMLDYDYYQLVLSTASGVNARSVPNTSSNSRIVYQIKMKDLPFILLEEVEGESIQGNNIWYKIQADSNITDDGKLVSNNTTNWPEYNWNGAVYVHSSYLKKINEGKKDDEGKYHTPQLVLKDVNNYHLTTYASNSEYLPKVGLLNKDTDYYYSSTLLEKQGTISKNNYVVILEEVKNNNDILYHIITDYGKVQKAWISSENVQILNKDLVRVFPSGSGYIDVLDKNNNSLLQVYNGSFLPIVDKELINDKLYLKVQYKMNGSTGYIDSTINNIAYTLDYINLSPTITGSNRTIVINSSFNPLENITASDPEDGDLTKQIVVTKNNVDVSKAGEYEIEYQVTDSYGNQNSLSIKVIVTELEIKEALFMYHNLHHEEKNKFTISGFMGIKGMDNIDVNNTLIFVNELTKEEYSFSLDKWEDYPYEMSSIDDKKEYNYSGGWFKKTIDLSKNIIPNGNYTLYVKVINNKYEAKTLFTNIAYGEMTRRAKGDGREYAIDIDYSTINSPLVFSIRDNLISLDVPKTIDPMYNYFNEIVLDGDQLTIKGTSHSIGINYGIDDSIERKLVLENKNDFTKYEMELGSITNGDYPITLAVSDNMDKTRAWYNNTIDLSLVPSGTYVLYIKNTVNNITYYGEMIDVAYTNFDSINNEHYQFKRNDDLRLRMELTKK